MKHRRVIFLAGAWLAGSAAFGADTGFYIGGSLGQSSESFDASTFYVSSDTTAYKVAAGFRPLPVVAGEVDYVGFGRAYGGINYADTYAVGVSALGFLPIPMVDVYGRLGLTDWRTNVSSPELSFHRTGADLTYGVGAGMSFGDFGVRVEYERFDVAHANTMDLATVGVVWTFL